MITKMVAVAVAVVVALTGGAAARRPSGSTVLPRTAATASASPTPEPSTSAARPVADRGRGVPRPTPSRGGRIMPLGDSITLGVSSESGSGYRGFLDALITRPHAWAGSQVDPNGRLCEGHSGWRIDQLADNAREWVAAAGPVSMVLINAGSNDAGQGHTAEQMFADMQRLIAEVRAGGAAAVLVMKPSIIVINTAAQQDEQRRFNAMLDTLTGVTLVDLAAHPIALSRDNVHPRDAGGYDVIAQLVYAALPASMR